MKIMCEKLWQNMHLHSNFDTCLMHTPLRLVHLTHQNLSTRAPLDEQALFSLFTDFILHPYHPVLGAQ